MPLSFRDFLLSCCLFACSASSFAANEVPQSNMTEPAGFFSRKAEGWFWYEVEAESVESKAPVTATEQTSPPTAKPILDGNAPFSAAWVRENLPLYMDLAWTDPTPNNVKAYLYLKRYALDKSEQFTNAWELAMVGDPLIDEISRRPTSSFATTLIDQDAHQAQLLLINDVAKKAGLFHFFSSTCSSCEPQAQIIESFAYNHGFSLVTSSLDGNPLPSGAHQGFKIDSGLAQRLGITSLPATVLVTLNGQFEIIGNGPLSLPELQKRVLIAARRQALISEQAFEQTKPLLSSRSNTARMSITDAKIMDHLVTNKTSGNPTNFVEPDQLLLIFKGLSQ